MRLFVTLLSLCVFVMGCCSHGKGDCEEGVSITILYDEPSRVTDMKVRYEAGDASGKAVYRLKEKRFFIEDTSATLGDALALEIILDDAVISQETYPIDWNRAVCSTADGPRWCADDTYEWAEIEIDLREDDEPETD